MTKKYGVATVLNDVNISFEKGKIHGLIGRNGSGKTILMKCICGFVPVTQGSVTVNGKKIGKDIDVPENLGAIIEIPGLAQAIMANHSAEDIDVLCDTVCEMDLGVLTRVK